MKSFKYAVPFKLLASGALAVLLALTVDLAATWRALAAAHPGEMAGACTLFLLTQAVNAARLNVLLPDRSYATILTHTLAAQAYTLLLPGQLAGEAVKAFRLGRGAGRSLAASASAVAFDKLTGLAGVLILTLAGAGFEAGPEAPVVAALAAGALLALTAAAAVLTWGLGRPAAMRPPAFPVPSFIARCAALLGTRATAFLQGWRSHARRPRTAGLSLLGGIAAQALSVAGCLFLGAAFGIHLTFTAWCVVVGALSVLLLAPVTIGGLGLREGSLVGLLGLHGVPAEDALALALAVLAIQLGVGGIGLAADLAARRPDRGR